MSARIAVYKESSQCGGAGWNCTIDQRRIRPLLSLLSYRPMRAANSRCRFHEANCATACAFSQSFFALREVTWPATRRSATCPARSQSRTRTSGWSARTGWPRRDHPVTWGRRGGAGGVEWPHGRRRGSAVLLPGTPPPPQLHPRHGEGKRIMNKRTDSPGPPLRDIAAAAGRSGWQDRPEEVKPRRQRRRVGCPMVRPRSYTKEEILFLKAMDTYKRANRRPWPSWIEVLNVLRALGYRQVAAPTTLPGVVDLPESLRSWDALRLAYEQNALTRCDRQVRAKRRLAPQARRSLS